MEYQEWGMLLFASRASGTCFLQKIQTIETFINGSNYFTFQKAIPSPKPNPSMVLLFAAFAIILVANSIQTNCYFCNIECSLHIVPEMKESQTRKYTFLVDI